MENPAASRLWRLADGVSETVQTAARRVMAIYRDGFQVHRKEDRSPVTCADFAAHEIIGDGLLALEPGVPMLSEEGEIPPFEERARWQNYWLVDPLDGTREFVDRNDEFTVNIALIQARRPVLGLIYAPVFGLLYAGARGCGAWKIEGLAPRAGSAEPPGWEALTARGRRLEAGGESREGPTRLVGSRSHQNDAFRAYLARFRRREPEAELLVCGSALKFCYLAEGRATVYPCFGRTMEWDTAAGQAIVNQVGKTVRSLRRGRPGKELVYNKKDLRTGPFIAR